MMWLFFRFCAACGSEVVFDEPQVTNYPIGRDRSHSGCDPHRTPARIQTRRQYRRAVPQGPSLHDNLDSWGEGQGNRPRSGQGPTLPGWSPLEPRHPGTGLGFDRRGTAIRSRAPRPADSLTGSRTAPNDVTVITTD